MPRLQWAGFFLKIIYDMALPLEIINDINDSKIRHIISFLPILTIIYLFSFPQLGASIILVLSVICAGLFEFNWTIFNKNKDRVIPIMKEYRELTLKVKLSEKEQWIFFKKKFNFINLMAFFIVMLTTCILFIVGMIYTLTACLNNFDTNLGILSIVYIFVFVYTFSLIKYNQF